MTNIVHHFLHLLWRFTQPLRRPLTHKLHNYMDRSLAPILRHVEGIQVVATELSTRLTNIETRLGEVHQKLATTQTAIQDDFSPTLEGVVRDLARFETQIEWLRASLSSMKRIGDCSSPLDKGAA